MRSKDIMLILLIVGTISLILAPITYFYYEVEKDAGDIVYHDPIYGWIHEDKITYPYRYMSYYLALMCIVLLPIGVILLIKEIRKWKRAKLTGSTFEKNDELECKEDLTLEMEISVYSCLKNGLIRYHQNFYVLVLGSLIMTGGVLVFDIVSLFAPIISLPYLLFAIFILPILTVGWYNYCLNIIRRERFSLTNIFYPFKRYGAVLGCYMLYQLLVVLGSIAIIAGIVMDLRLRQSLFAVIDKRLSASESLEYSNKITYGFKLDLFRIFMILEVLILISSPLSYYILDFMFELEMNWIMVYLISFVCQLFIVYPLTGVTFALIYEYLIQTREKKKSSRKTTPAP